MYTEYFLDIVRVVFLIQRNEITKFRPNEKTLDFFTLFFDVIFTFLKYTGFLTTTFFL